MSTSRPQASLLFRVQLSTISSETPAPPAPIPPQLPDPRASQDRPASPAPPAGYPAVSPASRRLSAPLVHPGKPAQPAPAPLSHRPKFPLQAAPKHPCVTRASYSPPAPTKSLVG